jgi:hypothetical protein
MNSVDLEELEKVLKLRAAFDYGTQPIEFLWGYDRTLIEAVPKLIARVRELERQRELLAERLAFICRSHNDCVFECPNALLKIDCPDVTFEQWIEAAKEAGE